MICRSSTIVALCLSLLVAGQNDELVRSHAAAGFADVATFSELAFLKKKRKEK